MRKRIFHVLNWDKYQSRTDKDMPWCKLWGSLFDRPWFQNMPDSAKFLALVLLDLARKTGNRIGEEYVFIGYLRGNYGILSGQNDVFKYLKLLSYNEFLSDNTSDIEEKIREEKKREENPRPSIEDLNTVFEEKNMAAEFFDYYQANGWKVGKNPMKDWKAAARNWKRRQDKFSNNGVNNVKSRKPFGQGIASA